MKQEAQHATPACLNVSKVSAQGRHGGRLGLTQHLAAKKEVPYTVGVLSCTSPYVNEPSFGVDNI